MFKDKYKKSSDNLDDTWSLSEFTKRTALLTSEVTNLATVFFNKASTQTVYGVKTFLSLFCDNQNYKDYLSWVNMDMSPIAGSGYHAAISSSPVYSR